MRWDAGALSPHRNYSSAYRYLSDATKRRRYTKDWPWRWKKELGIFLNTPGVTWTWVRDNFNMGNETLRSINNETRDYHYRGIENLETVTETDAILYMKYARWQSAIPFWVAPFVLDDLKLGMSQREAARKYHIAGNSVLRMRKGVIGNVFHIGRHEGWRKNLGR